MIINKNHFRIKNLNRRRSKKLFKNNLKNHSKKFKNKKLSRILNNKIMMNKLYQLLQIIKENKN